MESFVIFFKGFKFIDIHPLEESAKKACRYDFGRYFTEMTIVTRPLLASLIKKEQLALLARSNNILSRVNSFIDQFLDPNKLSCRKFEVSSDLLRNLGILEKENYLLVMDVKLFRCLNNPNSSFINN